MKARHKELLARVGIEVDTYFLDGWPPVWGIALRRNGEDVAVIESHGDHHDDARYRNKFILRRTRSVAEGEPDEVRTRPGSRDYAIRKTQREAIADFLQMGRLA